MAYNLSDRFPQSYAALNSIRMRRKNFLTAFSTNLQMVPHTQFWTDASSSPISVMAGISCSQDKIAELNVVIAKAREQNDDLKQQVVERLKAKLHGLRQ